jgi:hypothetical protein
MIVQTLVRLCLDCCFGPSEHKSPVISKTNLVAEVLNRNIGCSVALRRNEDFKHG